MSSRSVAPLAPELAVPAHFRRSMRDYRLARWIPPTLHGAANLPPGPCLLVGNHGPLGVDTPLLVYAVYRDTGRILRPLADRFFFTNPVGRYMVQRTASVLGTPANAHALLSAGEAVLVYPGGARETQRGRGERYQLSWEGRLGFARSAMRAGVPWVPVACIGNDEIFRQVLDRDQMAATLPGRLVRRFLGDDYVPPLLVPRMRSMEMHYLIGEPIEPSSSDIEDDAAVSHEAGRVQHALEKLLEQGQERHARRGRPAASATP